MRIQQTYNFILILQTIIIFAASVAIFWALLVNCSYVPFLLLLLTSVFIFVSIYISNNKLYKFDIDKKTSVLSIFVIWILLIFLGAIPLYLIFPEENMKDIFFLTVTLVTTNGIWTDIQYSNNSSFLIWQSILQWLGGLCTIIVGSFFVEMVLSRKGMSKDYFSIENVRIIFLLYIFITIIFSIIFKFLLEDWNKAFQISMALLSTSNAFNSSGEIIVEFNIITKIIMIFAMVVGSLSINLHYKSFTHGFLNYSKSKNLKIVFSIIFVFVFVLSIYSFNSLNMPFIEKYVDISFLIISFVTTTGLIPENLFNYGVLNKILILLAILTLVGGAISSTSGGIKATRLIYIYKYIHIELFRLINPRKIMTKEKISNFDKSSQIFLFCILYILSIPLFTSLLSIFDVSFENSFVIVVSAITNSGIGLLEIANINYYPSTIIEIIILSLVLLCGRIEIFLTMILFYSLFGKRI